MFNTWNILIYEPDCNNYNNSLHNKQQLHPTTLDKFHTNRAGITITFFFHSLCPPLVPKTLDEYINSILPSLKLHLMPHFTWGVSFIILNKNDWFFNCARPVTPKRIRWRNHSFLHWAILSTKIWSFTILLYLLA